MTWKQFPLGNRTLEFIHAPMGALAGNHADYLRENNPVLLRFSSARTLPLPTFMSPMQTGL